MNDQREDPKVTTTELRVTGAELARLAAGEGGVDLVPVRDLEGNQVAMRIVGVKPGTVAERLGARNGDTIDSFNDHALSSVSAAYAAAGRALETSRIVIRGARDGAPWVTVLLVD